MPPIRALAGRASLVGLGALWLAGPARLDLDVSIPPGSALEWGRAFPALAPRERPLLAPASDPAPEDPGRTRAPARVVELERGLGSSFGLLRVLTWDLAVHLEWVRGGWPEVVEPRTGGSAGLPASSEPLYWIGVSTLLRRLLHPALVPGPEVSAHLVELGEPLLPLLEIARGQRGLEKLCDDVRARIQADSRVWRRPLPAADARRRMLSAFVLDELTTAHPYDPDAGFGARLFLLGGEALELVSDYTQHPDPFTRRNAVAALGRDPSRAAARALVVLAATSDDDVVLVRALAALGAHRELVDGAPLARRLERETDPVRRVALAAALGRLREREGLGPVLALAEAARKQGDSDLLVGALAALARIPAGPADRDLVRFLESLESASRARPQSFREDAPASPLTADRPFGARTRGDLLAQLATLARARLALDERAQRDVLALRGAAPRERGVVLPAAGGALGGLLAPAQLLWIETAAQCGERGVALLDELARDPAADLQARAHALAHLPPARRAEAALALLADPAQALELAARALELLERDRDARRLPLCRALLARWAGRPPASGSPAERQLWLLSLRTLEAAAALGPDELHALLPHLSLAPRPRAASLAERLRERARATVRRALASPSEPEQEPALRELIDFARAIGANPMLADVSSDVLAAQFRRVLLDLRRRPRVDEPAADAAADALVEVLLGHGLWKLRGGTTRIDPPVPLEEELLLALGRLADPRALEALTHLARTPDSPLQAPACLALALTPHRPAAPSLLEALVEALRSPTPFTRLAAAESLRHLTSLEEPLDWYTAPERERTAAIERLRAGLAR